jgi:hypothetical protein
MEKIENELTPEEIAFYHNQKKGDVNSETGEMFGLTSPEFADRVVFYDQERKKGNPEAKKESIENVKLVLDKVEAAGLQEDFKNIEEQKKLLIQKKEIVKELMIELREFIEKYIDVVSRFNRPERDLASNEESRTTATHTERMKAHNNLIEHLENISFFLKKYFGLMDEEKFELFKNGEKINNRDVVMIERFEIPKNGILPNNLNMDDRNDIRDWAFNIYESLLNLKKDLDKKNEGE